MHQHNFGGGNGDDFADCLGMIKDLRHNIETFFAQMRKQLEGEMFDMHKPHEAQMVGINVETATVQALALNGLNVLEKMLKERNPIGVFMLAAFTARGATEININKHLPDDQQLPIDKRLLNKF